MAAAYGDLFDLLGDAALQKRARFALMVVARDVRGEDPETANHDRRKVFSDRVLTQSLQRVTISHIMMEVVISPNVIANGAAVTDADLFAIANAAFARLVDMETL